MPFYWLYKLLHKAAATKMLSTSADIVNETYLSPTYNFSQNPGVLNKWTRFAIKPQPFKLNPPNISQSLHTANTSLQSPESSDPTFIQQYPQKMYVGCKVSDCL
jgi:hypothetical protein